MNLNKNVAEVLEALDRAKAQCHKIGNIYPLMKMLCPKLWRWSICQSLLVIT